MRAFTASFGLFPLALLALGPATAAPQATPRPTPESATQHVTVPSLPGQPNKEGTVKLDGTLRTDSEGNLVSKRMSVDTGPATPTPQPGRKAVGPPATTPNPNAPVGPAPSGKAVTAGANYAHVRGVVTSFEAGKSVTVKLRKTRAELTYTFAPGANVPGDIQPGETVRVRLLVAEKGRIADRVERVAKK